MLVLTRRINESIIINGDIKVTVVDILNGKIRLGVEAPQDITVNREEIEDKKKQKQSATLSSCVPS